MKNLLHALFGSRRTKRGSYPEALVQAAIERAVDGTDARLRLLPGYRKRLRDPVIHAIRHACSLVDAIPSPLPARHDTYGAEPRLAAVFASADDMLERLGRETSCRSPGFRGEITALLLVERSEKRILGVDLVDGVLQREVAQTSVSFLGHRLLHPTGSEHKTRRQLKRRAFDHLLGLARTRLIEVRAARTQLVHRRDRLRRQLTSARDVASGQSSVLKDDLNALQHRLAILGTGESVLRANMDAVTDLLSQAERQLWSEPLTLHLDPMNLRRDPGHPAAHRIDLLELRNTQGRCVVPLLLSFAMSDLPPSESMQFNSARLGA
ncbi:MAG: hypothetical protein MZV65_02925 [Chromatiales bacterium]|nr:hypothetical protein [Chromatiales bacterium]